MWDFWPLCRCTSHPGAPFTAEQREKKRDHRNHCTLSPVPHPSPLASSERLLSQKPAESQLHAPHITTTYASCTRCTARGPCECTHAHTHTYDCCILQSYGTVSYGGMLVSSPHPPPYREKLHRTGASDGAFITLSTDEWVRTLMWFVWNSGACISFLSFLLTNLSDWHTWP